MLAAPSRSAQRAATGQRIEPKAAYTRSGERRRSSATWAMGIGQLNEAPLIEEKHESSMRLPSPPAASSASQVLLAAGRAFAGVSCTYECWIYWDVVDL